MAQQLILLSNELNRTNESADGVEKFHASECYALLGQIGFLSEDKVALLLDQGKLSDRRNRMLEALQKTIYAKIAALEGNFSFAIDLYDQVAGKINVLKQGSQQESALAYFYYENAGYHQQTGDLNAAYRYLEKSKAITSSNKIKQMISFRLLELDALAHKKFSTQEMAAEHCLFQQV